METIQKDGITYAILARRPDLEVKDTKFFTPNDSTLQMGVTAHEAGYTEKPHYHKSNERKDEKTAAGVMHKGVIALKSADTVAKSARLAKENAVSQFPVMREGKVAGSISTGNLIGQPGDVKIGLVLDPPFPTVQETTPISSIKALVKSERAVIVFNKEGEMLGIVTAEDLL